MEKNEKSPNKASKNKKSKRIKTKTSAFGTSKREGHDATQFYSSNLYANNCIDEKQKIIDDTNTISLDHYQKFSKITDFPNNSAHLLILNLFMHSEPKYTSIEEFKNCFSNLISEIFRVLITGGRFVVILNNSVPFINGINRFYPYHALIIPLVNQKSFLMRGETIWTFNKSNINNPTEIHEKNNLENNYARILIYSKQVLKRIITGKTNTISRDQFLSYTKSVWKNQPSLLQSKYENDKNSEVIDIYEHIAHLYSFSEDILLNISFDKHQKLEQEIKKIRPNSFSLKIDD